MGSAEHPQVLAAIKTNFTAWYQSITHSRDAESLCGQKPSPSPAPPSDECEWQTDMGLEGSDLQVVTVKTKEECCGHCKATAGCAAADFNNLEQVRLGVPNPRGVYPESAEEDLNPVVGYRCHMKVAFKPAARKDGSVACVPKTPMLTV